MKIQAGLSNGDSVTGTCWIEIEGPAVSDADALDIVERVLASDYASSVFSQNSGTPTIDVVQVRDLSRTVPLS